MASDLIEPRFDPEGTSPEAVLQFLSQHRHGAARRVEGPSRRRGRRGRKNALLGIVVALALAGVGVLVWKNVARSPSVRPQAADTTAARSKGARETAGASRTGATRKKRTTVAHRTLVEPWHRGLEAWTPSTKRHVPNIYYGWLHSHSSCAAYATYGCWKAEVVARHGCPHGVMMVVEETRNGANVGASWGFSRRLAPRARAIVEVDADQTGLRARLDSLLCRPSGS